ncbi:helix-turn-helix domain-containing protein [Clostridium sp. AF21-20LB]|uniref:LysR family transcriptional regulator n=1 Tax=Clostridium sp. AF21-20LB TaxID=2293003 RepID=UPI001FA98BB5
MIFVFWLVTANIRWNGEQQKEDFNGIKQLEYFMVACEKGSFNQAAECLYTSQPNVSKVIGMLEQELGRALFERTSRGLRVTPYGETVREYAHNILNHVSLINSLAEDTQERKFTVSTYRAT